MLRLETRDENAHSFYASDINAFTPGLFSAVDRTSNLETRIRGEDTTVWYSSSQDWPRNPATTVRAVLGTDTLGKPQSLRVMYQLMDASSNTRVSSSSKSLSKHSEPRRHLHPPTPV